MMAVHQMMSIIHYPCCLCAGLRRPTLSVNRELLDASFHNTAPVSPRLYPEYETRNLHQDAALLVLSVRINGLSLRVLVSLVAQKPPTRHPGLKP